MPCIRVTEKKSDVCEKPPLFAVCCGGGDDCLFTHLSSCDISEGRLIQRAINSNICMLISYSMGRAEGPKRSRRLSLHTKAATMLQQCTIPVSIFNIGQFKTQIKGMSQFPLIKLCQSLRINTAALPVHVEQKQLKWLLIFKFGVINPRLPRK